MRLLLVCMISMLVLVTCSKTPEKLNCDSQTVQSSLLDYNKIDGSQTIYYSRNLTNFNIVAKDKTSLECRADLILQSNLDSENKLQLPVSYKIYIVNSSLQSNTSALNLSPNDQIRLQTWINKVNLSATLLGDYQATTNGALYVFKKDEINQILYFNGKPVHPLIMNDHVNIEKSYTVNNNMVFLIGSYTGGTIDSDTQNNYLIQINADGKYFVSPVFAYITGKITKTESGLIIQGIYPTRLYIESTDYPVYSFESGVFKTLHDSESEGYYQTRFSKMQPRDIANIAKADQCYDSENNILDSSHACGYALKYCVMFKSLINPVHDQYYDAIANVCN